MKAIYALRALRTLPILAALSAMGLPATVHAQPFTKADSGWVRIFNGQNLDGFYSRMYGQGITDIPNDAFKVVYPGTDTAAIYVSSESAGGHIGTDKKFRHYRMRLEYAFDKEDPNRNAGLTYHTDETVPRMNNNWPRSIECQMMQSQSGWAYSIQQLTFDTRIADNHWDANGANRTGCASGSLCNAREFASYPLIKGGRHWNRMEIIVRGSDSAIHMINDTVVFKLWNLRVYNDQSNPKTPDGPHDSGSLGVQAEGSQIRYRRWEIMEFHPDNPSNVAQRLFLTSLDGGAKLTAGTKASITWKSLGEVAKVSVYFHTGDGKWEMAADNISNTGSFSWTVPTTLTQTLRVKVSAAPWVSADSSAADNQIVGTSGLARPASGAFTPKGSALEDGRDVKGRLLSPAKTGHRVMVLPRVAAP